MTSLQDVAKALRKAGGAFAVACAVGVLSGAASAALSAAFDGLSSWFFSFDEVIWALPAVGVAELCLYRALGLSLDLGSEDVARAARTGTEVPLALAPAIFLATCMSVACGASVGKEAAAVQLCAALASGVALLARRVRWLSAGADVALICGMSAGIGALLRAPAAGVIMAFETMGWRAGCLRRACFTGVMALASAFVALATSTLLGARSFLPTAALLSFAGDLSTGGLSASALLGAGELGAMALPGALALLGVACLCVAAGLVHRVVLRCMRGAVARRRAAVSYGAVVLGGLAIACAVYGLGLQPLCCSGFDLLPAAFAGEADFAAFAGKALLTLAALGAGFKGGEIMPSLVAGALLGSAFAGAVGADPVLASAVGMLSFFAGAKRCPLSACVMGLEMVVFPVVFL